MIKYISFDLDGTLASEEFDTIIWNEEIPKLYAEKHKLPIETAKEKVYSEYYASLYIEKIKNSWTDIGYWFNRLGLNDWKKLLEDMKHKIFVYDDSKPILEYLHKKGYKLIIVSSAHEKFLDIKLEAEGLKNYFDEIYSAPSTFNISLKNKDMFEKVVERLKIKPNEILHVGDDIHRDYDIPSSIGIAAYHLVRSKETEGKHIIHSLLELKEKL